MSKIRVTLWDVATPNRGRGNVVAVIEDAKDVGVSAYANDGGEMFFTLPANHPQVAQVQPWLRHYEVSRYDIDTASYSAIGVGLLDDYDSTEDEVIAYGRDYLSLFNVSITPQSQSYTSATYSSIIQAELSNAINAGDIIAGTPETPAKAISLGTISSVSTTTTVLSSYQSRLEFIRQLTEMLASDGTLRPIVKVSRTSPFTVTFEANAGADREAVRLEYGGSVNGFRLSAGYDALATYVYAVGQKREGSTLLFSTQTYGDLDAYGIIQRSTVFLDVINQTALDNLTKRYARDLVTPSRNLSLRIRSGAIKPVTGWDIADSVRVVVSRGLANINALYTVWGWEWIGKKNGSEDLFLDLRAKQT